MQPIWVVGKCFFLKFKLCHRTVPKMGFIKDKLMTNVLVGISGKIPTLQCIFICMKYNWITFLAQVVGEGESGPGDKLVSLLKSQHLFLYCCNIKGRGCQGQSIILKIWYAN